MIRQKGYENDQSQKRDRPDDFHHGRFAQLVSSFSLVLQFRNMHLVSFIPVPTFFLNNLSWFHVPNMYIGIQWSIFDALPLYCFLGTYHY